MSDNMPAVVLEPGHMHSETSYRVKEIRGAVIIPLTDERAVRVGDILTEAEAKSLEGKARITVRTAF